MARSKTRSKFLIIFLELLGLLLCFNFALYLMDVPRLDIFHDDTIKKQRFSSQDNVFRSEGYSRYHVNSYGLVGNEPVNLNRPGVIRTALFGDSLVEALQVSQHKKFASLLENDSNAIDENCGIETWNYGFQGDNLTNSYYRYVLQANSIPFDIVLFFVNEGDLFEITPLGSQDVGNRTIPSFDSRLENSMWFKFKYYFQRMTFALYYFRLRVKDYFMDTKNNFIELFADDKSQTINNVNKVEKILIPKLVKQIKTVDTKIKEQNKNVFFVGLPTARAMPEGLPTHEAFRQTAYQTLANALEQSGVNFINTYPGLADVTANGVDPYSAWEPGGHLNEIGHDIVAKQISAITGRSWQQTGGKEGCLNAIQ